MEAGSAFDTDATSQARDRWGRFLDTLAHDLRNPLGPIQTATFLLKCKGAQDPEVEALRLIIERQTELLAGLIDGMCAASEAAREGEDPLASPVRSARPGLEDGPVAMAPPPRKQRVLLIDDDADDRCLHQTFLEQHGYEVLQAESGEAGLCLALAQRPDAALVDLGLPGMDGLAFASRIRAKAGPTMFLVALTGHGHLEAKAQAMAVGFDAFLTKGAAPSTLIRVLQERRQSE